jgi:RNA polymerase sigma-70 factor (ECF subfamily)
MRLHAFRDENRELAAIAMTVGETDREARVPDTFDTIYEREFDYVWNTLGRLGTAPADLPDRVHDVFVVVHKRWSEIDPTRPIRPWLFGIARRIAAGARRKRRETAYEREAAAPADDSLTARDLLWRALAKLDDERREVIVLKELDGFTGAEIADILGIPVNTVHSRLRLGRADLVAALAALQEHHGR